MYDAGYNTNEKLKTILEIADVPDDYIQEILAKPKEYRETFLKTIRAIMKDEVINLLAFMDMKKDIKDKMDEMDAASKKE
jgi:hypothetical protein